MKKWKYCDFLVIYANRLENYNDYLLKIFHEIDF